MVQPTTSRRNPGPRALVFRLHAIGGILIAPLIVIAALSGLVYAISPSVEKVVYHQLFTASQPEADAVRHSLEDQVRVAQEEFPNLEIATVISPRHADENTRILFSDPGLPNSSYTQAVFIDPYTLHVDGTKVQYGSFAAMPLRTKISEAHRALFMGQAGRFYSELAASWMGVLALGGLWLWWERRQRNRRQAGAARRTSESPRSRQRRLHSRLGLLCLFGMLFFTVTGLTWSTVAGGGIDIVRTHLGWLAPKPVRSIDNDNLLGVQENAHADHHAHHGGVSIQAGHAGEVRWADLDAVEATARAQGLDGRLLIYPPEPEQPAWLVKQGREEWRFGTDAVSVLVDDSGRARVLDYVDFGDWPLAAKLTEWMINAHMGFLFGWINQLVLVALCIGIIVVAGRGYRMWFMRGRGRKPGPLPRHTSWREVPMATRSTLIVAFLLYSLVAPLFGASLLLFLIVDYCVGVVKRCGGRRTNVGTAQR